MKAGTTLIFRLEGYAPLLCSLLGGPRARMLILLNLSLPHVSQVRYWLLGPEAGEKVREFLLIRACALY